METLEASLSLDLSPFITTRIARSTELVTSRTAVQLRQERERERETDGEVVHGMKHVDIEIRSTTSVRQSATTCSDHRQGRNGN